MHSSALSCSSIKAQGQVLRSETHLVMSTAVMVPSASQSDEYSFQGRGRLFLQMNTLLAQAYLCKYKSIKGVFKNSQTCAAIIRYYHQLIYALTFEHNQWITMAELFFFFFFGHCTGNVFSGKTYMALGAFFPFCI